MDVKRIFTREDLTGLKRKHAGFVGIDSDGCVLDTMEIKQKQCFHPRIIKHWRLEAIEKYLRESAEFVNLYSTWRGKNRFLSLLRTIDLLRERPEVIASGVDLPEFKALRKFIHSGLPLGNPSLEQVVKETGDLELAEVLAWSKGVNEDVARTVRSVPLFKWARESLDKIRLHSDAICVSQTPQEALLREWEEHDLGKYVAAIAGQELGSKTEHIRLAAGGKYDSNKILMIGDAPGDMTAARENDALFYPINPGHEETSWERFFNEAYDKFLEDGYAGDYESRMIAEFNALLPETPPWERGEGSGHRC